MCMPAYDPADDAVLDVDVPIRRVHAKHIQDRLDAREYYRDRVTMLQSKGWSPRRSTSPANSWTR
jgi:hypothetical protein